jgi:hypothetical protein
MKMAGGYELCLGNLVSGPGVTTAVTDIRPDLAKHGVK